MAQQARIARPYAKAIFDFAGQGKAVETLVEELKTVGELIDGHAELRLVCRSEAFSAAETVAVISELSKSAKLSKEAGQVLRAVAESRRLSNLHAIADELERLVLQQAGVMPVSVESSEDLDDSERKAVVQKFEKVLGKPVQASFQKSPSLLGGIRVEAAGKTFDGSISTRLTALREHLVGGS